VLKADYLPCNFDNRFFLSIITFIILKVENLSYSNEDQLILGLKENQRGAYEYLYDNYSKALYGVICRIVDSEEIASDILQSVFVKIWKNIGNYDVSKGRLYTWMLNIARNEAIDTTRSKDFKTNEKNRKDIKYVSSLSESDMRIKPEEIDLKSMVDKLDPNEKIIVDYMYFKGYTQTEIAEELAIPLGTVKTRVRNAVINLRKYYN